MYLQPRAPMDNAVALQMLGVSKDAYKELALLEIIQELGERRLTNLAAR